MNDKILLGHGSGGKLMHELIRNYFFPYFSNPYNQSMTDATLLGPHEGILAVTTDSFVVDPVFFPGGDIGKLAVCGTVNDLAVSGAKPLYLTAGFILEEGFPLSDLTRILESMKTEAREAGVYIVAGDTKVVDKGKCDKIFINTTGIGIVQEKHRPVSLGGEIKPGDRILVNGTLGDHGMAVMASREGLNISSSILSDCATLSPMIGELLSAFNTIRFMRDATRGGVATVLCEMVKDRPWGIEIEEEKIPLNRDTSGLCEMLGFDPLYVANEGKVVLVAGEEEAGEILKKMKNFPLGEKAAIIGTVRDHPKGRVILNTLIGGKRIIDMLAGEQLPRIC